MNKEKKTYDLHIRLGENEMKAMKRLQSLMPDMSKSEIIRHAIFYLRASFH